MLKYYSLDPMDQKIDTEFVQRYDRDDTKRHYRALDKIRTMLSPDKTPRQVIEDIREGERMLHDNLQPDEAIRRGFAAHQHSLALAITEICGWRSPFDTQVMGEIDLSNSLTKARHKYPNIGASIAKSFSVTSNLQFAWPPADVSIDIRNTIKHISAILRHLYGISIRTKKTAISRIYWIESNSHFIISDTNIQLTSAITPLPATKAIV